ncbi:MAG: LacI family DNA-binding transcriptional regulator [Lachnospiraceae bacterium]|nr:LacI family DNA-binding transcriptional regulator [Lachnospiraceae bacterium]
MPTIKEIAELAGVSRGTVDRVLNNRGSVNPETAERIIKIAKQLDYKPNRAGLVLAAQKKNIKLGVILFGEGNPFFEDVVEGIHRMEEELSAYNCQVLIRWTAVDANDQIRAIDELAALGISGLAISPTNSKLLAARLNTLTDAGIPIVTLNTDLPDCNRIAYVGSNYYQTGETAAGLMRLAAGKKDTPIMVGIVSGSDAVLCHTERTAGFINKAGSEPRFQIVDSIVNDEDDDLSYERTLALLKRFPQINALFFAASGIGGGCRAIIDAGRDQDMTVITYDTVPETERYIRSGLISATICQQPMLQGRMPLEILFSYLAAGQKPKREYFYTTVDIRILENLDQKNDLL